MDEDTYFDVIGSELDWHCLNASDFSRKRPPERGSDRKFEIKIDEDAHFGFITNIFRWKGTTTRHIAPKVFSVFVLISIVNVFVYWLSSWGTRHAGTLFELPKDFLAVHSIIFATLGFLVVKRSTQAFDNYILGRKYLGVMCNNVREATTLVYSSKLHPKCDLEKVRHLQVVIRRKLNLLIAFIRQQLRESTQGFSPSCGINGKDFNTHWHLDPCKPPVGNLISRDEKIYYSTKAPSLRPAIIQAELNLLAHQLADMMLYPGFFVQMFHKNAAGIVDAFKSAYAIVETDVPASYQHLLYTLIFAYVFITPIIFVPEISSSMPIPLNLTNAERKQVQFGKNYKFMWISGWAVSTLVCVAYYGIMEIAAKLHNPFGYDDTDHDIELFGIRCHNETLAISKSVLAGDLPNYIDGAGLGLEWVKWNKKIPGDEYPQGHWNSGRHFNKD